MQDEFDWRKQEEIINGFPNYRADIDGLKIHYIHERGRGSNPLPIVLTHGFPDSFFRFYKVIPMLADPESYGGNAEDSFDVVVPKMPAGGHFAALEEPEKLVEDIRAFFRPLRETSRK